MAETFVVYIDESGDEGFRFPTTKGGQGSSEWFILSAVVTSVERDPEIVRMVAKVRQVLNKPPNFLLHFRDLRHEQRVPYISEVAAARLRAISILVHKPSLKSSETFSEKFRLYFYTSGYLLERVSWLCRDSYQKYQRRPGGATGDGSARIIFSNRATMPYAELRDYLSLLLTNIAVSGVAVYDARIDASVCKVNQVETRTHGQMAGLQVADAVASSFFQAAQANRFGFTEPRFVEMLKPVHYAHNGRVRNYGVKWWPKEAEQVLRQDTNLKWAEGMQ